MFAFIQKVLAYQGERIDFDSADPQDFMQHITRYEYAARHVSGDVLDIACGVGYGSYYLAAGPAVASVIGVDISAEAVRYARRKFVHEKLSYRTGNALAMPFADASFNAVVSLETLEHIRAVPEFLAEVKRVLRPGGVFIVSVPNKKFHTDVGFKNKFHFNEMYYQEFRSQMLSVFPDVTVDYQLYSEERAARLLAVLHSASASVPAYKKLLRIVIPVPLRRIVLFPLDCLKYRHKAGDSIHARYGLDFERFIKENPGLKAAYAIVPATAALCDSRMGNLIAMCRK
jgi:ubiquinone/menaquinone biosynthesis C-methylase UbiE